MHFYITGDTHRSFDRIEDFCYGYETTTEDVMIILGDAGINYWLDLSDRIKGTVIRNGYYIFLCSWEPRSTTMGGGRL